MTSMSRTGSTVPDDVVDVGVLEAAHHLHDRVDLADVGEELVAEPSPWLAPFTRPAMSTNSIAAGMTTFVFAIFAAPRAARRAR
jgi:hypothetical protein